MRKCARGEQRVKRISIFEQFHETRIRCAHNRVSDICILCSRILWALISLFDWSRLPIAELERNYLQSVRDKQNVSVVL